MTLLSREPRDLLNGCCKITINFPDNKLFTSTFLVLLGFSCFSMFYWWNLNLVSGYNSSRLNLLIITSWDNLKFSREFYSNAVSYFRSVASYFRSVVSYYCNVVLYSRKLMSYYQKAVHRSWNAEKEYFLKKFRAKCNFFHNRSLYIYLNNHVDKKMIADRHGTNMASKGTETTNALQNERRRARFNVF